MPTYEYACRSCGEHLEVVQSFSDEPLSTCPKCGGPVRKVFGSIGFVLKGSGFYKTDNRKGSSSSSGSSSSKAAESSGDKTSDASGEKSGSAEKSGSSSDAKSSSSSKKSGSAPAAASA